MTVLITGGTGNTGFKLARLLHGANIPVLITSRSGTAPEGFPAVRFYWFDSSTFSAPFEKDHNIDTVYLVTPSPDGALSLMKPFIDLAIEKGVKQWVLLGGSSAERGRPDMGGVHGYLDDKGVDHALLRPTWFSDNFSSVYLHDINTKNEFASSVEDGRIPFVTSQDIAQAAFEILTTDSKVLKNSEPYIVGPELFSYDEAAALLSEVIGRKIMHRRRPAKETRDTLLSFGVPKNTAEFLSHLEVRTANGAEETVFNAEDRKEVKYTGKKTLREYFEENKGVWASV
ncbi:hypothetical protein BDQ17DRAFT_1421798 [Cyathus striatus]|nr:hypothetical protein BDQ17DRAFT_1421798 [Cyathus striatus]